MLNEIYSALLAFAIVLVIGPKAIEVFTSLKMGQSIRQDGPSTHLKKAGTPTMGGIMTVSYTHLDVYKRQLLHLTIPEAKTPQLSLKRLKQVYLSLIHI